MRVLIIFNHPAPYKVNAFNELAKYVDLTVIFERTKAKDRPDSFYKACRESAGRRRTEPSGSRLDSASWH